MTVVVVGSVNTDLVATGDRLPSPGETVGMHDYRELQGGKGANQAAVAASLGARVRLVAAVGADDRADRALEDLRELGVDLSGVVRVAAPTGVALIMVDAQGENSIAIVEGANGLLDAPAVSAAFAAIDDPDAVVVACLEVPIATVVVAAEAAAARGWPFVLNPAPAVALPDALVRTCAVITPNATEVAVLGGAESLLERGARAVVETRGAAGAILHRSVMSPEVVPAVPAAAVDAIGAGDAFTAALAVALDRGVGLAVAVRWAAAAGAIATEDVGARGSLPRREAVLERMTDSRESPEATRLAQTW